MGTIETDLQVILLLTDGNIIIINWIEHIIEEIENRKKEELKNVIIGVEVKQTIAFMTETKNCIVRSSRRQKVNRKISSLDHQKRKNKTDMWNTWLWSKVSEWGRKCIRGNIWSPCFCLFSLPHWCAPPQSTRGNIWIDDKEDF